MAKNKKFGILKKELIEKLIKAPQEDKEMLFERIKYRVNEQKKSILDQAFKDGYLTEEEYNSNYKDMFYDEFGFDGFLQYLYAAMNAKSDCFVTLNKNLIKKRGELEAKFKLKIITTKELEAMAGKKQ